MQRHRWLYLIGAVPVLALLLVAQVAAGHPGTTTGAPAVQNAAIWSDVAEAGLAVKGERLIVPDHYRTLAADLAALDGLLAAAPQEQKVPTRASTAILSLPLPNGTFGRFSFVNSPIMAPALAAQYPAITTYLGQGLDDPAATVRFDRTPAGFHASILAPSGTVFIDPYSSQDPAHYISYYTRDFAPTNKVFTELGVNLPDAAPPPTSAPHLPSGSQLRTYRLALAADGEYTQFFGGTIPQALAAIVTSINRVDGVYEQEVAVRLVLIANEAAIIYTDPNTDPYTNNDGAAMLGQNQSTLDSVIGNANYDVGHVFSTGGGGIADLRVPCRTGLKAQGVTGSSNPVGDPYDIDYVAHEMGHQFGGNHTFNGTTINCGGGNRNASTAYEPGSGSTIMAYAGICGGENLQLHSDAYFHTVSFDEIVAYTTTGQGNSCPVTTNTGNNPPVVNPGASFTIPQQTYFQLTGSATDADNDPLTYDWEQFNAGAAAPPNTDDGTRAIFRSFNPTTSPTRFFPKLSDILNNTSTFGEALPMTNRTLTFRLTARDNRTGGGGVNYASVNIPVTTSSGPFLVTSPNTAVSWPGGSAQTVTWDVANTTAPPVSCATVDITLSTDGGNTWPLPLAFGTANDGTQGVTAPNVSTTQARVQVACSTNIFFDVSNVNFTIVGGPTPTGTPPTSTPIPPSRTTTPTATVPTATQTSAPTMTPCGTTALNEGFENALGVFTSTVGTCVPGGCGWNSVTTPGPHSGTRSAFAPDLGNISDQYLTSINPITIPAAAPGAFLSFWHDYELEETYDGGVLEVSTDGGTTWQDVLAITGNSFVQGGYVAPIDTGFSSPIAGREAWTGLAGGYIQTTVNLGGLIGSTFKLRFREANDDSSLETGWSIDDVTLLLTTACGTPVPITPSPTRTMTPGGATPTATACPVQFADVPVGSTFYNNIRCLACRGIVSGYPCGGPGEPCPGIYYRPNNNVTRGQTAKIVSESAGFSDAIPSTQQTFQDVAPGSTFALWVERLSERAVIGGYPCGGAFEPCISPGNRPYFRPNNNVTRGQLSKITSGAAGWTETPTTQTFEDVAPGSTFYLYVERVVSRGIVSGYPCGSAGEPCVAPTNRPYFRPNNNATRGQMSKIAAQAFFPNCSTPAKR